MKEEIKKIIEQVKLEKDVFIKAKLLKFLNKEKNLSIISLAKILSLKPAYLCHLLRLLKLPEIIIDGYYSKTVSLSHLVIISRLKNKEQMIAAYEEVLSKNLSTAKTEELVREKLFQIRSTGEKISKEEKKMIEKSFKKIDKDLQVKIIQTRTRAKVILTIKGACKKTTEVLKKLVISN